MTWQQLRSGAARSIALLVGMLLATTAFTVLTAASSTAQLRTIGTVSAHFAPAYDILVRPDGARSTLETQSDTVQPNFLSGIYGGITLAQYHQIAALPGVQLAAPIAMVGYAVLTVPIVFSMPAAAYARNGRQLYRVSTTWVSDAGTSRITQPPSYTYITPDRLRFTGSTGAISEVLPGHASTAVCPLTVVTNEQDPFGIAAQSHPDCWSKIDGYGLPHVFSHLSLSYGSDWVIPVLIAAIDPVAEAKLDGLNKALVSGKYLTESAGDGSARGSALFPALAASASGMDEYALTQLQLLAPPKKPPLMNLRWIRTEGSVPGRTLITERTTAQQAYRQLLHPNGGKSPALTIFGYWSSGSTSYRRTASGALTPLLVHNRSSVWYAGGVPVISVDNEDSQYRAITVHAPLSNQYPDDAGPYAGARLVGIFDPAEISSFDRISAVPLGAYQPVAAAPANAASRKALHGGDLLPNQNLGGYVSQPVNLITTLSALPALQNSVRYTGNLHTADPISVIRVRVAGVTGPNPLSLERIREAAQLIEQRTHLDVDIVAGSSPTPTTIDLPTGRYGRPALTLTEDWVKKGVAVAILSAVDKNSLVLFILILVVCVLFIANSATAAVRGRRRELGVLACLGWTRPRLFAAVLGELAAIGLTAGILGAAAALPLSSALGLHASPGRAALAVPIAVAVALIAGALPSGLAARAVPVASIRPPVLSIRRARQPGGVTALAAVNVLRTPGRSLVGAASLAIGITALTVLTAVTIAFRGVVVGSLLGDAVAVQVRGVDYVATVATVALGVFAVADVVFLNIRERAAELATMRTFGWRESTLSRLVVTEAAIIGIAGSLAGAALGLAATARFTGQLPAALDVAAAAAVAAGAVLTAASALLPAQALRRQPAVRLLAEE
jgi:hypothetical protein